MDEARIELFMGFVAFRMEAGGGVDAELGRGEEDVVVEVHVDGGRRNEVEGLLKSSGNSKSQSF